MGRSTPYHENPDHRARGVHGQQCGTSGQRGGPGRTAHRGMGVRPAGTALQHRRRPLRGQGGPGHRHLLPPGTRLQHRGDVGRARCGPGALLGVVPSVPVGTPEAVGVPGVRRLRAGFPHQHHLQRKHRLPHEERSPRPRRLRHRGARSGAPVVGKHPDARARTGRQHPVRGDGPLRHHPVTRRSARRSASDRVHETDRGQLRRRPLRGLRAAPRQDRRLAAGRRDGHL